MPKDPRWNGRRAIAETRLRRNEARIERAIDRALARHKATAMTAARVQTLTAAAHPDGFDIVTWDTSVDDEVLPVVGQVFNDLADTTMRFFQLAPNVRSQMLGQIDVEARAKSFTDKVRSIGTTYADRITTELTYGAAQGEGYDKLTNRISDVFDIAQNDAARIARTETHGASESISHDSAKAISAAGYQVTKTWIATDDDRTRPDHADADGQTVNQDDAFDVGGEELMYPGDPDGSPDNVINCRCSTTFAMDGSDDDAPDASDADNLSDDSED